MRWLLSCVHPPNQLDGRAGWVYLSFMWQKSPKLCQAPRDPTWLMDMDIQMIGPICKWSSAQQTHRTDLQRTHIPQYKSMAFGTSCNALPERVQHDSQYFFSFSRLHFRIVATKARCSKCETRFEAATWRCEFNEDTFHSPLDAEHTFDSMRSERLSGKLLFKAEHLKRENERLASDAWDAEKQINNILSESAAC